MNNASQTTFVSSELFPAAGTIVDSHLLDSVKTQKSASQEVIFPDAALASKVCAALNIPEGDPITQDELEALISLTATSAGITDISGLEYATNAVQLELSVNQIQDLTPLGGLQDLYYLGLSNNDISDLSPIENLPALTTLAVNYNNITDISPVNTITSLQTLGADGNNISDISSLSGLVNMSQFSFVDNNISDISVVENYPNLRGVYFSNNPLSSIEPLCDRTTLQVAVLNNIGISDFSVLTDREALGRVEISNNNVTDISFIKKSKDFVVTFMAESDNITDLTPLKDAAHLKILSLYNNPDLKDISPIDNAPVLADFGFPNTSVTDLTHVNKNIFGLYIAHDKIDDFSPISNITYLQMFNAVDTGMKDVSFLKDLTLLNYAMLDDNQITDLRSLSDKYYLQFSVDDQVITLDDTTLGQSTSLSLFNREGNVPPITWYTPGSYDPDTETVTWDNPGLNALAWSETDERSYIFAGTLTQYVSN
ncbi:leucine-rich repeat domain-containing protein [Vagococcus sp. WN89Y]|uniref:leucine-rich repeat domain-containing protein n=1 Tax=Vagococcus sp. WN89Y TaxID=3457258 RepID=UPI003FCEE4DA